MGDRVRTALPAAALGVVVVATVFLGGWLGMTGMRPFSPGHPGSREAVVVVAPTPAPAPDRQQTTPPAVPGPVDAPPAPAPPALPDLPPAAAPAPGPNPLPAPEPAPLAATPPTGLVPPVVEVVEESVEAVVGLTQSTVDGVASTVGDVADTAAGVLTAPASDAEDDEAAPVPGGLRPPALPQ